MVLLCCYCGGFDGGGGATTAVAFVCEDEALSRTQARCAIVCVFAILCCVLRDMIMGGVSSR